MLEAGLKKQKQKQKPNQPMYFLRQLKKGETWGLSEGRKDRKEEEETGNSSWVEVVE